MTAELGQEGTKGGFGASRPFPVEARRRLQDPQLRANLSRATQTIRRRRLDAISELPDFEELREAAAATKEAALSALPELLEQFERASVQAGAVVHFARDAAEAREIIRELVLATGHKEVVKVKSMTTAEIELNAALEAAGVAAVETDLAELIVQLGDDLPSHIVVPAIHRNRSEVRRTFVEQMGKHGMAAPAELSDRPEELAAVARVHLRDKFLRARVAISGANFAVAETGSLVVVESEGNGRMCLTLPDTLISVVGIDKVVPKFEDLEIFLQLLARSATGERLSPYTSIWTGAAQDDGPSAVHIVLLDNGRTHALANPVGRQALRCIRCAACLNVCPVYERVGGHAYGSVYPGPIGAVLAPQLDHVVTDPVARALPFASSLCGACYEVCPVRIDIPRLLVHLRGETVAEAANQLPPTPEALAMRSLGWVMQKSSRFAVALRAGGLLAKALRSANVHQLRHLPPPLSRWTESRDAPMPAGEPFRAWWKSRNGAGSTETRVAVASAAPSVPTLARRTPVVRAQGKGLAVRTPREAVLLAARKALSGAVAQPAPARSYQRAGAVQMSTAQLVELFTERLRDYGGGLVTTTVESIGDDLARLAVRRRLTSVVVPKDIDATWLDGLETTGIDLRRDDPAAGHSRLDSTDAAVTGAELAVAETGTILLAAGPAQGRRALSLLVDHHVVVLHESQIVANVPDAIAHVNPTSPQTWISGPSATSDIEMQRVEGVHGPRHLDVLLVAGGR